MQEWKHDIKDWQKITDKTASLMLSQCETALKETIQIAESISSKAEKLASIILPILSALIVYVMSNWNDIYCFLPLTSVISCIVLLTSVTLIMN